MAIELLTHNDSLPIYNIKAVANKVGLLPVTLRAWERRYGLPVPKRGGQGYRLYSEHDVRTLRWLKAQLELGMSISRASELLNELRQHGQDPAIDTVINQAAPTTTDVLKEQFMTALTQFNEPGAAQVLRRGFALYPIDEVLVEVIEPVLIELGNAWHAGEMPIAVEHFATQFCVQHLMSMLAAAPNPNRVGTIVAACAPGELHQIGLIMLVVLLRWRGWDVRYLGQNLNLERMAEALTPLHPNVLLFTATRADTARALEGLAAEVAHFPAPKPKVVLGGQGMRYLSTEKLPGLYLEGRPLDVVQQIERLVQSNE